MNAPEDEGKGNEKDNKDDNTEEESVEASDDSKQKKSNEIRPREAPDDSYVRFRLPRKKDNEMFGIADQLLGASRIRIMCADGKSRMGRIPGKLKKRMWIRAGDLVIIRPWSFQDEKSDIVWRYTKTQAGFLSRRRLLPDSINIF
ncbi:MAG: translation initiation factor eIF-1A [Thermoplasmata archaeon]|nr:MAG: translation initiation factor eIF-1A [Thermoplasmata archaeon]